MGAVTAAVPTRPRLWRVATAAAIVAGLALLLKAALIIVTTNTLSPTVEGFLFLVGVALPLVAAAGLATASSSWAKRVGIGIGVVLAHLFFIMMLADSVGGLVDMVSTRAYLADELPLGLLGLVWLAIGLFMRKAASTRSDV